MAIYVDDLRDAPKNAVLLCPICEDTFSATHGDYFWKDSDEEFVCDCCGCELVLAVPTHSYAIVKE